MNKRIVQVCINGVWTGSDTLPPADYSEYDWRVVHRIQGRTFVVRHHATDDYEAASNYGCW